MVGIHLEYPRMGPHRLLIHFMVREDSFASDREFLSNPRVRQGIQDAGLHPGDKLGYASLRMENGVATWVNFYPFDRSGVLAHFKKRGIGRLLEIRVLEHIQREYPSIQLIRHSPNRSGDRIRELRQRNLGSLYSLRDGLRTLRFLAAVESHAYHTKVEKSVAGQRLLEKRRARRRPPVH